jgi:translation initiation factor 3 subunit F
MTSYGLNLVSNTTYQIHPVVILSILDHYKRRNDGQSRVIGTLLGERRGNETIIKSCFSVPHKESEDAVEVDMDHQEKMLKLQRKINSKVSVVGWYATGADISYISSVVHNVYAQKLKMPVHLTVDVHATDWRMGIRAYHGAPVTVGDKPIVARFESAELQLYASAAEKIGMDAMINGQPEGDALDAPSSLLSDLDNIRESMLNLSASLATVSDYVSKVAAGELPEDIEIGRAISQAVMSVPIVPAAQFEQIHNNHVQDLLMVTYLANLTRTQLAVADRIGGLL